MTEKGAEGTNTVENFLPKKYYVPQTVYGTINISGSTDNKGKIQSAGLYTNGRMTIWLASPLSFREPITFTYPYKDNS